MNSEEKHKIRLNYVSLKEHITLRGKSSELLDHLIQFNIICTDDYERILFEGTSAEKVERLLRVIQNKPHSLIPFCEALEQSGHDFLANKIRETDVDQGLIEKEQGEIGEKIESILTKAYSVTEDVSTPTISMQEIQREIEFGFLASGKVWQGEWATIEIILSKVFPKAKKKRKKGSRGLQHRQVSSDVITNEEYLKKLTKLDERLKKIQELKKLKVTSREREEIQKEDELKKERDELIKRRDDFLSGTAAES